MANEVECVYKKNPDRKIKCVITAANSEEAEKTAQLILKDRNEWTCVSVRVKESIQDIIGNIGGSG